jgi:hypothetical protein
MQMSSIITFNMASIEAPAIDEQFPAVFEHDNVPLRTRIQVQNHTVFFELRSFYEGSKRGTVQTRFTSPLTGMLKLSSRKVFESLPETGLREIKRGHLDHMMAYYQRSSQWVKLSTLIPLIRQEATTSLRQNVVEYMDVDDGNANPPTSPVYSPTSPSYSPMPPTYSLQ